MSVVVAFSLPGKRQDLLDFVDAILAVPDLPATRVSVGPGSILLSMVGGSTEDGMRIVDEAVTLVPQFRFELRAAIADGDLRHIDTPEWIAPNAEGSAAIRAARLVSKAEPNELVLDEAAASHAATSEARAGAPAELVTIVGKHTGETFPAFRVPGYFGSRPEARKEIPAQSPSTAPVRVELTHLPDAATDIFIGRHQEFLALDAALAAPDRNVFVAVAGGGNGKTALVEAWLKRVRIDGWRGIRRVYAWSFFSQGASDSNTTSSDEFFADALKFFGHDGDLPKEPMERARRLLDLVRAQKTLLIIDGVEPLQYPPGPRGGKLKDHAVLALLKGLATAMDGLCVATTREPIADLKGKPGSEMHNLPPLSEDEGADLLEKLGAHGSIEQRRTASKAAANHALAVTLLGKFIAKARGGDVRCHSEATLLHPGLEGAEQAKSMMDAHVQWFTGAGQHAEVQLLRLMGLFDRPVPFQLLKSVLVAPAIAGMTDLLCALDDTSLELSLANLREVGLLLRTDGRQAFLRQHLDAHPIVREHFAERLQKDMPTRWQSAHERVYRYLTTTRRDLPKTAADMEPLWMAIGHGCKAGLAEEVVRDIFVKQIDQGKNSVSTKFGLHGAALSACAHFFTKRWSEVSTSLSMNRGAWIYARTGYELRSLGRLREAEEPVRHSIERAVAAGAWQNASRGAMNMSELQLGLGEIASALAFATDAIEFADKSGLPFERSATRSSLANALVCSGDLSKAEVIFAEATSVRKTLNPPRLHSTTGAGFRDFKLQSVNAASNWGGPSSAAVEEASELKKVIADSTDDLANSIELGWTLDIGLAHLTLGRALHALSLNGLSSETNPGGSPETPRSEIEGHFHAAVAQIQREGSQLFLAPALIHRATFWRIDGRRDLARLDLENAIDIATQCEMRLSLANAHLAHAWLAFAEDSLLDAQTHVEAAKILIDATGYRRRDGEVAALRSLLAPKQVAS